MLCGDPRSIRSTSSHNRTGEGKKKFAKMYASLSLCPRLRVFLCALRIWVYGNRAFMSIRMNCLAWWRIAAGAWSYAEAHLHLHTSGELIFWPVAASKAATARCVRLHAPVSLCVCVCVSFCACVYVRSRACQRTDPSVLQSPPHTSPRYV